MKFLYSPDIWWLFPAFAYFSLYLVMRSSSHNLQARSTISKLKSRFWNREFRRKLNTIEDTLIEMQFENEPEINQYLSHALDKSKQKSLKLAVVGEFSSGKSTLINALLGEEILRSSPLPTTTVSNSVIYSRKRFFEVKDKANNTVHQQKILSLDEQLSDQIKKYTATDGNEELKATIGWNSPFLKDHIDIFDTPGVNSLSTTHKALACKTIETEADFLLVLIKATQPLPVSLISFLSQFRINFAKRVAFVVTHIDHVRPKERDDLLVHIKNRISEEFHLEKPFIYDISSSAALDYSLGIRKDDEAVEYHAKFKSFVQDLRANLKIGRKEIINSNIELILEKLKSNMLGELSTKIANLDNKMQSLKDVIIKDEYLYKDKILKKYEVIFSKLESECAQQAHQELVKEINFLISSIGVTIKNASSTSDLRTLGETIPLSIKNITNNQIKYCTQLIEKSFNLVEICQSCEKDFWKDFNKLNDFSEMPISFDAKSIHVSLPTIIVPELSQITTSGISSSGVAGAAAGAAIGSMIFPGVGTLIGGIIGLVIGNGNGPDFEGVKQKFHNEALQVIRSSYEKLKSHTTLITSMQKDQYGHYATTRTNELFSRYQLEVKKLNTFYALERNKLEADKLNIQKLVGKIESVYIKDHQKADWHDKKAA